MKVLLQQLNNGRWQACLTVPAGDGMRYFSEEGATATAALMALRHVLRSYQGSAYVEARRLVLDEFAALP